MLGRYQDSIRMFSNVLQYILRTKPYSRSQQHGQLFKKTSQLHQLLAIAVSLQPQRIDEQLHGALRETLGEKLLKLQKGDLETYQDMFLFSCPKFIPVGNPTSADPQLDPQRSQVELFMDKVHQQLLLNTLKSYLRLYASMPVRKLASFMKTDEPTIRSYLLAFKRKSQSLVWSEGPPLTGTLVNNSGIDFYINEDMVHVAATKMERRYGQYFVRQIVKFNGLNETLSKIQ
ncbi:eukaryotic translation initiation factor 3 subunit L-like [Zophobas morio]|uniref:eukaryotic translation initiation factor 3 subunit L-like n=1 Tax=Zophobas morio TaxID=2755281 RepID=UPI0030832F4C